MSAFLILASLSVVFYLVMLVALYRDNRRRWFSPESAYTIKLGVVAKIGTAPVAGRGPVESPPDKTRKIPLWVAAANAPDRREA